MSVIVDHNLEKVLSKLKVMCWEGRWNIYPLSKVEMHKTEKYIEITNTSGIHNHAKVIYDEVLDTDFMSEIIITGGYSDLQMQAVNGDDRNVYVNPSKQGVDKTEAKRLKVYRQYGTVGFQRGSGRRLNPQSYMSDMNDDWEMSMPVYLSVAIPSNQTIRIYLWNLKIGRVM